MDFLKNIGSGQSKEDSPKDIIDNSDEKDIVEMNDMIKNFTDELGKALKEKDEEIKRLNGILEELKKTFDSVVIEGEADEPDEPEEAKEPEEPDEPDEPDEAEKADEAEESNIPGEEENNDKPKSGGYRYRKRRSHSLKKQKQSGKSSMTLKKR